MSIPIGFKHTKETKLKMKLNHPDFKGKNHPNYGKSLSEETKRKIGEANKLANKGNHSSPKTEFKKGIVINKGEKNGMWKGGITSINRLIRSSFEYEEWRKSVFERDLYTCQMCGGIGGYLEADHIKPFSLFPDLRFDLDNGRTLCKACHRKTDTWGNRVRNFVI